MFGYTGILRQEQYFIFTISLFILGLGFIFNLFYIHKPKLIFLILSFYLVLNVMFSFPAVGYKYLLIFFTGAIFYLKKWETGTLKRLFHIFQIVTLLFLFFTFLNYLYPSIILNIFGKIMSEKQVQTYQFGLLWGVPGIPGELSFNAFVLSIGYGQQLNLLFLKEKRVDKLIGFIITILYIIGIIMTSKRSAILLLPFITLAILLPRFFTKLTLSKFFLLISSISLLPILVGQFLLNKIEVILLSGKGNSPLSNRELYWNIALNMIKEKKFLGHGLNSYDLRFNQLRNHSGFAGAHNSFLQIVAELGAFGGMIYILFIVYNLFFSIKVHIATIKENKKFESYVSGCSIFVQILCIGVGMSESVFYQPQQLFTYLLFSGLCFSLEFRGKEVEK